MEKIIERGLLFDFYGELLTGHQREIYKDAVYDDLSLSELSEQYGITRQGVHDLIKRCDKTLNEYENKLHLVEKFMNIKKLAGDINDELCVDKPDTLKIKELTDRIINQL